MTKHLPPSILIIEQDNVLRTNISNILERKGFNVISVRNEQDTISQLESTPFYSLPNIAVIGSCEDGNQKTTPHKIQEFKKDTILIFLLDSSPKDVSNDLHYMVKPFSLTDLLQKIQLILSKNKPILNSRVMIFKDLKMDLSSYRVTKSGREIHLGPTEFKILQLLMHNPTKALSRLEIMKYVWNSSNVEERTIDVHVNRLRSALKEQNEKTSFIKTVRSIGYRLEE
ncbi:MAG: response regulator transcription factor [Rickettsiales bacterium]